MRFASTTISKAFLFIFYPGGKKIKRERSDFEYAQTLIKPSALEFWSSIATGFSGLCSQIYENIGNAQSHSTKAINWL
jgi:elongation factor P hydroxylase